MSLSYSGGGAMPQGVPGRGVQTRAAQPLLAGNATILYGGAPTSNTVVYFPGSVGSYMNLGTSSPANFSSLVSNTFVEFWVYTNSLAVTRIYGQGNPTTSGRNYSILLNTNRFGISYDSTDITSSTTVSAQQWYHVAVSIHTSTSVSLFVNGSLVGTSATVPSTYTSYPVVIGALNGGYFNGYIRDLRVVRGGVVPTTTFTPEAATWAYGSVPSYVTGGTNVLGLAAQYMTPTTLIGTPLFTQLSSGATSSAVGAFSLRAVNGTSVKAVAVQAHPVVQWPPVSMTSNTTVVSGQLYGNGTYVASDLSGGVVPTVFNMADNNINTYYEQYYTGVDYYNYNLGTLVDTTKTTTVSGATAAGWWVQMQLPTSIILRSYTLVGRQDGSLWNTRNPTTFWIAGSNDGSNWSNVHYQAGISYGQSGTTISVPQTSNSLAYSYYRLIVNVIGNSGASGNHSTLNIASWNLYGDAPSYAPNAAQDFYADRLGNLLTAPVTGQPLANWLGGATGYVTTWYDQSGRGNHATQSTAANQPIIQRATKGPGYMVLFNGVNGTTSYGLNFGAYDLLNNTSYSVCGVVRRKASGATNDENYYLSGAGGTNSQDQKFHNGYRLSAQFTLAHYSDDMNVTVPAFTTAETEPINYNFSTLGTDKVGRIYSYSGGSLYPTPTTTRTFVGFLNHTVGTSFSIGSGFRQFTGEIYEILVFTQSLYDLDGTNSITQIYNNQLGYTGT